MERTVYQCNSTDAPLTLSEGAAPVWSDTDIDDVIAFLETLTDRDARAAAADH
jgi:cytochrome c peroxidase